MGNLSSGIFGFLGGIITLATISVVLSKKSDSAGVIGAVTKGVTGLISAATAPVTGNTQSASGL